MLRYIFLVRRAVCIKAVMIHGVLQRDGLPVVFSQPVARLVNQIYLIHSHRAKDFSWSCGWVRTEW